MTTFSYSLYRYAPGARALPFRLSGLGGQLLRQPRAIERGAWRIRGQVTVGGVPAARLVRLLAYPSLRLIDATWSHPVTGQYAFDRLPAAPLQNTTLDTSRPSGEQYLVLGVDHTGQYDPEARIGFTLEAMP